MSVLITASGIEIDVDKFQGYQQRVFLVWWKGLRAVLGLEDSALHA